MTAIVLFGMSVALCLLFVARFVRAAWKLAKGERITRHPFRWWIIQVALISTAAFFFLSSLAALVAVFF